MLVEKLPTKDKIKNFWGSIREIKRDYNENAEIFKGKGEDVEEQNNKYSKK